MISDKNGEPDIRLKPERVPYSNALLKHFLKKICYVQKNLKHLLLTLYLQKTQYFILVIRKISKPHQNLNHNQLTLI